MTTEKINYFDCFATIGRRGGKDILAPWTVDYLLEEMDRCQIAAALVYSNQAKETHPMVGNNIVLEEYQKHSRLFPCWVGMPHHTGEFPIPDEKARLRQGI